MSTANDARLGPETSTDELGAGAERASSSSLIAGLPHISWRHPLVAFPAGGSRMAIAYGRSIATFELWHDAAGSVTATAIWRTEVEGTVTSQIGAPGRGLVATVERDGQHRAEVIDERGTAATLVALPSRPTATAVTGGRFIASFPDSLEAAARLVEIDLTTGYRAAERELEFGDIDIATSPPPAPVRRPRLG